MNAYTSSVAVMARRVEPADSLDFFPTAPWGTRAFCQHVLPVVWPYPDLYDGTAWDPCCGQGHMALALAEYFREVVASDIFDYGFGDRVADFVHPDFLWRPADWIIFNPPFNLAAEFIAKGLELARTGVAALVRLQFLESEERFRLFSRRPPEAIALFCERLPMHRGRWVIDGKTATAYCWIVWLKHPPHKPVGRPVFLWIPPGQRKALSKPDDWLRFGGCVDLAKTHPAMRLQDEKDFQLPRVEASLDDVAAELQGRLV